MNIDEYLIQRANAMNKSQIEVKRKKTRSRVLYHISSHFHR